MEQGKSLTQVLETVTQVPKTVTPARRAARTRKRDIAGELSVDLLAALENHRRAAPSPGAAAFLTLAQVVELCPGATAVLVAAAMRKTPCRGSVIAGIPGDPDSPLLLVSEAEQLVRDGAFLLRLVRHPVRGCSAATPVQPLTVLWSGLHASLRRSAADYWPRHLQQLPAGLQAVMVRVRARSVPGIHDQRYPRAEVVLAERMVGMLERLKSQGESFYPCILQRLAELASPGISAAEVETAAAVETMKSRLVTAFPGMMDSPVTLKEDLRRLASSNQLLNFVVSRSVTADNQGVVLSKLEAAKGLHPEVQPLFSASVRQMISGNGLPAGLGAIRLAKKWYVFRLRDVVAWSAGGVTAAESSAGGFSQSFDVAFDRLSAQSRLPGCVSLADLRPAMIGYSREEFDAELIRLRRTGRYSLSVVEGRYPLTDLDRQACLTIDNTVYLLVRRRS